jgi:uncharacterized protein YcfJ
MSSSKASLHTAKARAAFVLVTAVAASWGTAAAALDLASLRVLPQRGQSPDQARRDRYECHNWAVEQTGFVPGAQAQSEADAQAAEKAKRAERASRAIGGAAIGAAVGGLITSDRRHPGEGPLIGAAVGAAVGAATTPNDAKKAEAQDEGGGELTPRENDYMRALSACMEGRGYRLVLPSESDDDEDSDR